MVFGVGFLVAAFASIFTIVNPFSTASIFLALTRDMEHEERKFIARRAAIFAVGLLLVFAFAGSAILSFFSITIDAFRLAGGMLITAFGWQMVRGKRERMSTDHTKTVYHRDDISIVPIAIPFLAGPGAITTVLVLISEASNLIMTLHVAVAVIVVMVVSYIVLAEADRIVRYIGEAGKEAIEKIMGLIVMVFGVQFVINGIRAILFSWGFI
jgi:multiple antibiotic resistance protein